AGGGTLVALSGLPRTRTDPTFLLTGSGWNDDAPFPVRGGRRPRYEPPKPDDPTNGTLEEKRRGLFPVGVALETPLPSEWTDGTPVLVRVAVIGQGDIFTGDDLPPAKEQLFLQTSNWLLGREDYLPRGDHPWRYPRVELTLGRWLVQVAGVAVGMPLALAF